MLAPESAGSEGLPMLSDDVFRARLEATIASLRYWVPTISDTAAVHETAGDSYWKLAVMPHVAGACPFELMLRADQHYDLVLDGERFEDRPIESVEMFVPLVTAITDGRVIKRSANAAESARLLTVDMIVDLGDGKSWRAGRTIAAAASRFAEPLITDRRYLPYRR